MSSHMPKHFPMTHDKCSIRHGVRIQVEARFCAGRYERLTRAEHGRNNARGEIVNTARELTIPWSLGERPKSRAAAVDVGVEKENEEGERLCRGFLGDVGMICRIMSTEDYVPAPPALHVHPKRRRTRQTVATEVYAVLRSCRRSVCVGRQYFSLFRAPLFNRLGPS